MGYQQTSMKSVIIGGDVKKVNILAPASFVFAIKQAGGATAFTVLSETTLTATVGRPGGDKAPASRSILLDLKAGEKVAIYQTREGAESSYRLTFCAHLIRPTAPSAWAALTDPLPPSDPKIETENTYTALNRSCLLSTISTSTLRTLR